MSSAAMKHNAGLSSASGRAKLMAALHSLFHSYAASFLQVPSDRQLGRRQRLEWASEALGYEVESFTSLNANDASRLIDLMKARLGQSTDIHRSGKNDRDQAFAYGTAGRKQSQSKEIQLVDAATMDLIHYLAAQLGWTRARLDAFLLSPTSPLKGAAIRTLSQANKVIWALKNMLRRAHANNSSFKIQPSEEARK